MSINLSLVRGLPLFQRLTEAELMRLMSHATTRRIAQGDMIFEQGEAAHTFYLLLEGWLKVTQVTQDGQQVMVRVVNPGDIFGFARALKRPDYPATARAAVDCLIVGWPTAEWEAVVDGNPRLAVNAMQSIGQRLDEAHTRLREMSTQEVERRIAHTVLRLADKAGRSNGTGLRIDFPITRQDIAEMAGTTLHTVSRILSAWEARGLVEGGRQKLTVCDLAGVRQIADPAE